MRTLQLLRHAQFHGAVRTARQENRCVWTAALVTLLLCSITVVINTVNRYIENPTYIVKKEAIVGVKKFPCVLIFPELNFVEEKVDTFLNELDYPDPLNSTYVRRVLRQLAAFVSTDIHYDINDLENIQYLLSYNQLDVESVIKRLTASCDDILLRCRWRQELVNCSTIFRMEITRNGFSCIFNGRSLRREILEYGPHRVKPSGGYILRGVGFSNALIVVVDQTKAAFKDLDRDYKWVALQTSQHYVDTGENGTAIDPGMELWISYSTRNHQASDDAINLSSHLRKCRLENDSLEYFPLYHKSYCLLECEIRRTIQRCKCRKISYPPIPGVALCRAAQLECARKTAVPRQNLECHCPPACNVEFNSLVPVSSMYRLDNAHTLDALYAGIDVKRVSVLRLFIKKPKFRILQRTSYFTKFNLFSQLGGVFSMFFGCSILTLLELAMLTYTWLKNWWNTKMETQKRSRKLKLLTKFNSKINIVTRRNI